MLEPFAAGVAAVFAAAAAAAAVVVVVVVASAGGGPCSSSVVVVVAAAAVVAVVERVAAFVAFVVGDGRELDEVPVVEAALREEEAASFPEAPALLPVEATPTA